MKRGQILIELVLAIAVVTVVIVALASVTTKSISNTNLSRNQSQANNYAQEAIEWIRSNRDERGWNEFYTHTEGYYCLPTLSLTALPVGTLATSCQNQITGTSFIRYAYIHSDTATLVEDKIIEVVVTWMEGSRTQTVKQTTILTKT